MDHLIPGIDEVQPLDTPRLRAIYSADLAYSRLDTRKRLREVQTVTPRMSGRRHSLYLTATRKSLELNNTEQALLDRFPADGVDTGFWSNALIFSPALANLAISAHKAYISLVRAGHLGIASGTSDSGARIEVLIRLTPAPLIEDPGTSSVPTMENPVGMRKERCAHG